MTDLLRQGAAWLDRVRASHAASPVEYRRAADGTSSAVLATDGQSRFESVDDAGLTVAAHARDFLVTAASLGFEPAPGDVIVAGGRKFEVIPLGEDFRGWRHSDPAGVTYRIHTRELGPAL